MPDWLDESHGRRHKGIVAWELQFRRKDASFKGCAFGSFDHGFPQEKIVFVDRSSSDTVWRFQGKILVFLKEPLAGYRSHREGVVGVGRRNSGYGDDVPTTESKSTYM